MSRDKTCITGLVDIRNVSYILTELIFFGAPIWKNTKKSCIYVRYSHKIQDVVDVKLRFELLLK